jgi:hypothetical protein
VLIVHLLIQAVCKYLIKSNEENISPEMAFYLASIWKAIGGCQEFPASTVTKVMCMFAIINNQV